MADQEDVNAKSDPSGGNRKSVGDENPSGQERNARSTGEQGGGEDRAESRGNRIDADGDTGSDSRAERPNAGRAEQMATPGIPGHTAPAEQHEQHTRKGQAQSPRDLNHYEPPKKKEGH